MGSSLSRVLKGAGAGAALGFGLSLYLFSLYRGWLYQSLTHCDVMSFLFGWGMDPKVFIEMMGAYTVITACAAIGVGAVLCGVGGGRLEKD